ncbi:MAG: universal stress protein [Dyadobacter sp.]|uniref:universal stress protein n=1 Tax=Dyadobacter sp. TaxID=1914288 RepID=UPI001B1FE436|nr:universal stress protein [Dyadobacter sp.]MBO9616991.1 universal stress protein [Dyadobacter sp.]
MKNIRLVIDAGHLNTHHVQFACYVASLTQSRLTGIFMQNVPSEALSELKIASGTPFEEALALQELPDFRKMQELLHENESTFRTMCERQGVHVSVHTNPHEPLEEILAESRYADLMIIGSDLAFEPSDGKRPSSFLKEVLCAAECPVMIAPDHFEGVDEIVFAYDGNAAAAHAIKQFSYLLPELGDTRLTIVQVISDEVQEDAHDGKLARLVSSHYSNAHFKKLYGRANSELFAFLMNRKKSLVVMGSYGRSTFSNMLTPSTADPLIRNLNLPIFVAHR